MIKIDRYQSALYGLQITVLLIWAFFHFGDLRNKFKTSTYLFVYAFAVQQKLLLFFDINIQCNETFIISCEIEAI